MAEQVITSEAIMKAVAEATKIMIQTMAEMQAQRSENQQGPKLGGPALNSHSSTRRLQINTVNGRHSH